MEWFFEEVTDGAGCYRPVRSRDGRTYVRYPVGFPHRVLLRDRQGLLPDPAQLRLMKAGSLALERVEGRQPDAPRYDRPAGIVVEVVPEQATAKSRIRFAQSGTGCHVQVDPGWIASHGASPFTLEQALEEALRDWTPRASQPLPSSTDERSAEAPQVLLFRNIFSEHYHQHDASHFNPGTHVLATALRRDGANIVFCDGKLPYHDAAGEVPRRDVAMAPEEFLSDPSELERLLAENPDLDLVALPVIELCYNHLRHLIRFIRERSDAWIAIGGTWPTTAPLHTFANLPGAQLLVRGDGDRLIGPLARLARHRRSSADEVEAAVLRHLGAHHGVLARWEGGMASFGIDRQNAIDDLDQTELDFTLLTRRDVERGISLSLSRGCAYGCRFCTVMNKTRWRPVSPKKARTWLAAYLARLEQLYGSRAAIPSKAREVEVWDDDFFVDADRAAALVDLFVEYDLRITYVQGSVPSFFVRVGARANWAINHRLLDRLARAAAHRHLASILIGAENYSERELRRVGKVQTYAMIRVLASELARRGIQQSHLMILSNRDTSLDDLLDNLLRLVELRRLVGPQLHVNDPCWLLELYTTPLYRARVIQGTVGEMGDLGVARREGWPEFDFPFIRPQRPQDDEVYEIARRFPRSQHYGVGGEPLDRFEGIYGPADHDFAAVLRYIAAHLTRRLQALDGDTVAGAEQRERIQAALDRLARDVPAASPAALPSPGSAPQLTTGVNYRCAEDGAGSAELDSVRFRITHRCNRSCRFCFIPYQDKATQDLAVEKSIESVAVAGGPTIILTGGEPTLHPDVCGLIERARASGARRVELQTNAIRLADRELCRQLRDAGLAGVTVSLPSHRDDVLTEIAGVPHSLAKILAALDNLATVGLGVSITHVICPQNYRDVPDFVQFLSAHRSFLKFCFLFAAPIHLQLARPDIVVRFSDAAPPLVEALDFCIEAAIPFEGLSQRCGVPECILAGRRRYFPDAVPIPDENRSEDFMAAPSCTTCSRCDHCFGVRRLYAFVHGTAEFRPILESGGLGEVPAPTVEQVRLATTTPRAAPRDGTVTDAEASRSFTAAEQFLRLVDRVGEQMQLDADQLSALRAVQQDLHFQLSVTLPNGETKSLEARRARYGVTAGPTVGALEISAGADPEACRVAAMYRGIRAAAFELPMGGAHGVITGDPSRLGEDASEEAVRAFISQLGSRVAPGTDVLTPHISVPWEIVKRSVERSIERSAAPHRVSMLRGGRSPSPGSAAWMPSVASATAAALYAAGYLRPRRGETLRYAILGFGRAGRHITTLLDGEDTPCRLVACADSRGACLNPDGLPTQELRLCKEQTGRLPASASGQPADVWSAPADVLFLCTQGAPLDRDKVLAVQAPVVIDMSAAVPREVERDLLARGCLFVPAILSTSGPMIIAHLEWSSRGSEVASQDAQREISRRVRSVLNQALSICEPHGLITTEAVFALGLRRLAQGGA